MTTFSHDTLARLGRQYGTPLWLYDAATIRERIAQLRPFDVIRYAQKACSNLHILRLMRAHGVQVDAVSLGEIERALRAGYTPVAAPGQPPGIVFTADVFDRATLRRVVELGIEVNAGSIDMLHQLGACAPGHRVWLRINPGFGHGHSNKTNTGGENSKHGIWHGELEQALAVVRQYGLRLAGLHMHIGSGVDYAHLQRICGAMAEMVALVARLDMDIEAVSTGGGLSIPYRDGEPAVDTAHYFAVWDAARRQMEQQLGHRLRLEIEPGRFLVAQAGVLLAEVRAAKHMGGNHFTLVDAGFNELMRPSLYGSYHAMSVVAPHVALQRRAAAEALPTVVAGPLCESGDVFTQREGGMVETRLLPPAQPGDFIAIHDAGAYGASMSSNYNSRPLAAEVLVDGGQTTLIRRRQTVDEMLALEQTGDVVIA